MKTERRKFLKQASIAGAALAASSAATMKAGEATAAAAGTTPKAPTAMPKGMMLLTMRYGDHYTLGIKTDKGILDVAAATKAFKSGAPVTMDDLLEGGDGGLTALRDRALASNGKGLFLKESEVAFGPCVTNPQKIICVGLNYARHAKEVGQPLPKLPILFNKFNTSLNAHQGTVRVSAIPATNYDYEAELVIVIGRRASNVSETEALSYVLGYATGNDFTARDLQSRSSQWMIGKACDGFAPVGTDILAIRFRSSANRLGLRIARDA